LAEESEGGDQTLTPAELRLLQSMPDFEEVINAHVERVKREEKEFLTLQGQLEEALEALELPKAAATSADGTPSVPQETSDESKLSSLDQSHRGMSPAERVVDLLDRLSLAGQPLLERIIQSTDKDLDQLLSELDADEAAAATGVRSIEEAGKRDLVLNPNSLPIDRMLRKTPVSPTRALVRGKGKRQAALELENDADDEQKVREELTRWMDRGEKARRQGRQGLMSPEQREEMVKLLEKVERGETRLLEGSSEEAGLSINEKGPAAPLDMKKMAEITEKPPTDLSDDNWFTTVPSIGITKPEGLTLL